MPAARCGCFRANLPSSRRISTQPCLATKPYSVPAKETARSLFWLSRLSSSRGSPSSFCRLLEAQPLCSSPALALLEREFLRATLRHAHGWMAQARAESTYYAKSSRLPLKGLGWKSASPGSAAAAPPPPFAFPSASSVCLKLHRRLNARLGRNGGLETNPDPESPPGEGQANRESTAGSSPLWCHGVGGGGKYKKEAFFSGNENVRDLEEATTSFILRHHFSALAGRIVMLRLKKGALPSYSQFFSPFQACPIVQVVYWDWVYAA